MSTWCSAAARWSAAPRPRPHPHRRTRGARRHLDHRGQQDAAGQHLDIGAARHADGHHRAVGRGQVDVRAAGRRLHPPDLGHGVVRRPRHSRRVRLAALQDRDGAAGRRGARSADRQAGPDVRGRAAAATRHQQGRPRTGRQRGARRTRDDQPPRHPRRQALGRAAQARLGRARAADGSVAADPRRADVRPGPRARPAGDDDAAPAGRRRPRGAGGHALADLSRRVRSGAAAGAGRQDRVLRAAQPDRCVDGHHQLGRHLQLRRRRPGRGQQEIPRPARTAAATAAGRQTRQTLASRRKPACEDSSRRSLVARCG